MRERAYTRDCQSAIQIMQYAFEQMGYAMADRIYLFRPLLGSLVPVFPALFEGFCGQPAKAGLELWLGKDYCFSQLFQPADSLFGETFSIWHNR